MNIVYTDGGRALAGYNGTTKDCVVRSLAIITGLPYRQIYDDVNSICQVMGIVKGHKSESSIAISDLSIGVSNKIVRSVMKKYGGEWVATMGIGTGCRVHMRSEELPIGKLILNVSRHVVAVMDGVAYDNHDPSREGTRCVYGYWKFG